MSRLLPCVHPSLLWDQRFGCQHTDASLFTQPHSGLFFRLSDLGVSSLSLSEILLVAPAHVVLFLKEMVFCFLSFYSV